VVGTEVSLAVSFLGTEVGWLCVSLAQATAAKPIMSKQIAAVRFMLTFFLSHRSIASFPLNAASFVNKYLTFSGNSVPGSGRPTDSFATAKYSFVRSLQSP
jgi:hypothetical protein